MPPELPKPYGALSPEALFVDITFISDKQTMHLIQQHCVAYGSVADIAYDEELGMWVWHTLYQKNKTKLQKDIAERFLQPTIPSSAQEAGMVVALVDYFRGHGIVVDTNVACAAGQADLVTRLRDAVVEVKHTLSRPALWQAIGQVLLYRQAINPAARAIIVGRPTRTIQVLIPLIEQIGIEVMPWPISAA